MDEHSPWYHLLYNAGVRVAVIGVLAILALFLAAETMSTASNLGRSTMPATDTITVNGEGQATMAPDVVHISFTVQNKASTVVNAQAATTKQANAALDFVKGQGVVDKDVKTLSYDISPTYEAYATPCSLDAPCQIYPVPPYQGEPKITGYRVSQTVQVTMRELANVGALLEGLGKLGVQNVSGPAFALDDSTAGYDAARADAIDKARAQARLLVGQLGVRLGKIVNFTDMSGDPYYTYGKGGMVAMDAEATALPSVPTGENTYNASVSITYEIR